MTGLIKAIKVIYYKTLFINQYRSFLKKSQSYQKNIDEIDKKDEFKSNLWGIEVFDVLDNNGFSKVIKKMHNLKKMPSDYKVNVYYRKSTLTKLQYVKVEINSRSLGIAGTIDFLNDDYIRNITVSMTQINNNEFILCYKIFLKKFLSTHKDIHNCVVDNFDMTKKSKNFTWYMSDYLFKEKENVSDLLQLEYEWLRDWFQSIIEQLFYSEIVKFYRLPIIFNYIIPEKNEVILEKLKSPFLVDCFSNYNEDEFLHINLLQASEGCFIERFVFGSSYSFSNFISYFRDTGQEFYYYIFFNIEVSEINRRLGLYFTSIKRYVRVNDYKWLINKIRALKERTSSKNSIDEIESWIKHENGKRVKGKFINYPTYHNHFLDIFERYFEYLKSLNLLSYNIVILWVAGLTLFASIIGAALTLWFNIYYNQ